MAVVQSLLLAVSFDLNGGSNGLGVDDQFVEQDHGNGVAFLVVAMDQVINDLGGDRRFHPVEVKLTGQQAIDASHMAADLRVGVTGNWPDNNQFRWVKAPSIHRLGIARA